jgi:hypothetical protein
MSSQNVLMGKEKAKQEVIKLIEKYNKIIQNRRDIKSQEEAMTKKDLILPLFRALGWNIEDSSEVTAEERISKGWVDYGFRINGVSASELAPVPIQSWLQLFNRVPLEVFSELVTVAGDYPPLSLSEVVRYFFLAFQGNGKVYADARVTTGTFFTLELVSHGFSNVSPQSRCFNISVTVIPFYSLQNIF